MWQSRLIQDLPLALRFNSRPSISPFFEKTYSFSKLKLGRSVKSLSTCLSTLKRWIWLSWLLASGRDLNNLPVMSQTLHNCSWMHNFWVLLSCNYMQQCFYLSIISILLVVVLAQCSLFAEISTVQQEKETVLKYR